MPRSYSAEGLRDVCTITVHVFGDASEVGYGAAVYLRLTLVDGSVVTPLSRARVAPLKRVSLPRLELLGSLLAARLLRFVSQFVSSADSSGPEAVSRDSVPVLDGLISTRLDQR